MLCTVLYSFVLHFFVGCDDCCEVSGYSNGLQFSRIQIFLLRMCIDAPASRSNSLSFGFSEDGAGRRQTSEGEKNVALSLL